MSEAGGGGTGRRRGEDRAGRKRDWRPEPTINHNLPGEVNQVQRATYIKAVPEFQLIFFSGLHEETLRGAPSPPSASQPSQRGRGAIRPKQPPNSKVRDGRNQQRRAYEMHKDKEKREAENGAERRCIGKSPGQGSEEEEKGQEIGEGRVGTVPGVFSFCTNQSMGLSLCLSFGRVIRTFLGRLVGR